MVLTHDLLVRRFNLLRVLFGLKRLPRWRAVTQPAVGS
jgi:hypothetical protein